MAIGMGADPVRSGEEPALAGLRPETGAAAAKIFTITQYSRSVEKLLRAQVPQVWVKGVITQLNARGRIVYLTLAEFDEGDAKPKAVLEATLWTTQLDLFNLRFGKLPVPLSLRVELKVAFLLEPNFYVPSGRFQPRVLDVDEAFTVGELSLTRQRILERLVKDGLLGRNKERDLVDAPLRIGLITAPESAAYRDFISILIGSGYSFQISFVSARMQGDATEPTVLKALEILGKLPLDVICIVRGGGSKTDLVYFDSESICRAIALCPHPVLTGIGHEIDNTLCDLVAYADKITPTDCAKYLESMLQECQARLTAWAGELGEAWRLESQQAWHELSQRASLLKHEWQGRRASEEQRCGERARGLSSQAMRQLTAERKRLATDWVGLRRGPAKLLRLERLRFVNQAQAARHAWRGFKAARAQELREARLLLQGGWRAKLRSVREVLALKDKLVQAADPARMLGMGYTLVSDAEGRLVTSVKQVKEGALLTNRLKDGTVESRVESKKERTE